MAVKKTTAIVRWDEELAKKADIAAGMESAVPGGQFFSIKSGILSWQDAQLANNQMAVVILDSVLENVYYDGPYDPDVQQSPSCFAFGRDDKTMQPHKIVIDAGTSQHPECNGCPMNEFGTAQLGRGKACRNTRRLAMIPAGTIDNNGKFQIIDDISHFEEAAIGYMKLPVTSVKSFANFVKQVAAVTRRPPFGIITRVKVVPDAKKQFSVLFEPIANLPDKFIPTVMSRNKDVEATIEFPYVARDPEESSRGAKSSSRGAKSSSRGAKSSKSARKY